MSCRQKPEADNFIQSYPRRDDHITIAVNPSGIYQRFKNGHSRLSGNGLFQPLDSGLRRNDGRGCGQAFVRHGKRAVGMATNSFRPRRHSSEGWNPGEGAGECRDGRVYRMPVSSCRYYCHSRTAGIDGLNHWIPACAGMTVADSTLTQAFLGVL